MSLRQLIGVSVFSALVFSRAEAAINVSVDPGVAHTTSSLTRYSTSGTDMVGMAVSAHFDDGSHQTIHWGGSGAFGSSWSLTEAGDTFGSSWTLSNNSGLVITRLVIDGAPGDTLFDAAVNSSGALASGYFGSAAGSSGSENGWTFQIVSRPSELDVTATYRNALRLDPGLPFGDLWTTLDLQFTNSGGFGSGKRLSFIADTDNAAIKGSIVPDEKFAGPQVPDEADIPVTLATPEPGSLLVMGGLMVAALAGRGLRRRLHR